MFLALNKTTLKYAIKEWINQDLPILKYIVKSTTAALLALSICMYFNLEMPQTSVFTVFIVMQPFSGLVYSKSFYRLVGTIIGTIMALILVGAFIQDRVSFTLFFALWIGLCAAVGFMSRNFMSYGFVLSGYTIALVTMPIMQRLQDVFTFGIDRLSEVIIGLLCSSFISEILFPQKLSKTLQKTEKRKFDLLIKSLSNNENIFNFEKESINYAKDILGTDSLRINSNFETGMKKSNRLYYKRLNSEFMHISTTFFSLKNIINNNINNAIFVNSIKSIYFVLEDCLKKFSDEQQTVQTINNLVLELKSLKKTTLLKIKEEKQKISHDNFELLHDFNSISYLITRIESELIEYCTTYLSFISNDTKIKKLEDFSQNLKFSTHSDNILISLMITRGAIALILMMTFWMISGWKYAPFAIIPAVANTLLLSTAPNPVGATKNFLIGTTIALFITPIYNFYIIPMFVNDLITFCIFLTPVLAFISLLMILPGKNLIGFGFLLIFINTCAIYTHYNMNFISFADMSIATILGLIISGFSFILIDFASNVWIESRVKRTLNSQINKSIKEKLALQRVKLESGSFDLLQRYSAIGRLDTKSNKTIFRWVLSTLELGKAIINIRRKSSLFSKRRPPQIHKILTLIKKYFDFKNKKSKKEQLEKIKHHIEEFEHIHLNSANDQILLKDIYINFSIIYSIIKNREFLPVKGEIKCT
ncbi:FUSC family protein [Malaciobacter canalis]|uniref:FUSC family protein n=1 Tax=Malaciobacter canalis TaxID=1912871 RepID=UPI00384BF522